MMFNTCAFLGNCKEEEITYELQHVLFNTLLELIIEKQTIIFYTRSDSPFVLLCEEMIMKLKNLNPNLKLIKLVDKGYVPTEEDERYFSFTEVSFANKLDKYLYCIGGSDYIIIDKLNPDDKVDMLLDLIKEDPMSRTHIIHLKEKTKKYKKALHERLLYGFELTDSDGLH